MVLTPQGGRSPMLWAMAKLTPTARAAIEYFMVEVGERVKIVKLGSWIG